MDPLSLCVCFGGKLVGFGVGRCLGGRSEAISRSSEYFTSV